MVHGFFWSDSIYKNTNQQFEKLEQRIPYDWCQDEQYLMIGDLLRIILIINIEFLILFLTIKSTENLFPEYHLYFHHKSN